MTLYAESSAVLAWLLDQPQGAVVAAALAADDIVIASDLTVIECDRVIVRAAPWASFGSRKAVPDLVALSLDARVREAATALGLPLLPAH